MNHCIDCGKPVSCGRTHTTDTIIRCMPCQVALDLRGWRFETPVMKMRKEAKEKEHGA